MRNQMLLDVFTAVLQWTFYSVAASIVYLCGLAPRSLGLEDDILLALGLEDDLEAALVLSAGGMVFSVVLPIMSAVCLLLTYRLMLPHGLAVGFLRRGFLPSQRSASGLWMAAILDLVKAAFGGARLAFDAP